MSNNQEPQFDVYVKQEGYADFRFLSQKAKEWAHANKMPNSLVGFGKKFCGKSIWYPGMQEGVYKHGTNPSKAAKLVKKMREAGLVVEDEFCFADYEYTY